VKLNRMDFITEMECVSCAVRTETSQFTLVSGISPRRSGIDLRPGMWGIRVMLDNAALGQVSSKYFCFP